MADANANALPQPRRYGQTLRPDAWWIQPLAIFLGFSVFIVYSTWAAFHPLHNGTLVYWFNGNGADYLSPFFSPEIFGMSPHAWFPKPDWWPSCLVFSSAFFVLWGPGGFRLT